MFYEGLFDPPEESLPRDLQRLKKLIPGYYGVCDITDRAGDTRILFQWLPITSVCIRVCMHNSIVINNYNNNDSLACQACRIEKLGVDLKMKLN